MKTLLKPILLTFALITVSISVFAQPARYVEGTHFVELEKPVRTVDSSKVEVVEVFWYGCSHCYSFEPLLNSWVDKQADDVVFVHSPGMWNAMMMTHAQVYYTAEELGMTEELHSDIFDEILQRRNYLQNEDQVKDYFVRNGASPEEFDAAWNSFAVSSSVNRANTRMRDYGVRSTPNMIVNGKYRVSANQAVQTQTDVLAVVDFLVEQERSKL